VIEAERKLGRQLYIDEFTDTDDEFDVKNEKPICISCFNDLEHDGFSNYYCGSCGGWFSENEVITYNA
jgi:tRNA(Ile2) C34 agmatinyltransferase TiaS